MYKYYKQLDDPLNQTVVLNDYDEYQSKYIKRYIDNKFLESNRKVFTELNSIYNKYKHINEQTINNKISNPIVKDRVNGLINRIKQSEYDGDMILLKGLWDTDRISFDDISYYLNLMKPIVEVVSYIYPNRIYYMNVIKDMERLASKVSKKDIIYKCNKITTTLPDAWYLTKEGYLYNTMGINGHKESSLIYPFEEIQCNLKNFDNEIKTYRNELEETISRGYVTPDQCRHYLNIRGMYTQIEKDKIYDRQYNMLITGIIAAHIDLYDAFNEFYKLDNPTSEFLEMFKLVNCEMDDMFVRFLGMSKIGVSGTKTICTSNPNDRLFSEYTKRGYKVDLVNPICVVNNHIREVDLNTHKTITKVLNKDFKSAIKEL